ncbi:hypothetical protein B296_00004301 [Ensete ventricosum]|uniref:Uncharacterized protein n=1 Tax=Ensete ventricosum TaxID=4639 RepID=A0A427B672_ENSVE|nr:hypothetical protein B296_00004301 [Ensete ventricosum]
MFDFTSIDTSGETALYGGLGSAEALCEGVACCVTLMMRDGGSTDAPSSRLHLRCQRGNGDGAGPSPARTLMWSWSWREALKDWAGPLSVLSII